MSVRSLRSHRATLVRVTAVVLAFLVVALLVLQRSESAFSGVTDYGGEQNSATVSLDDDDAQGRPFDVSNMIPGDSITRCVMVTYGGTTEPTQLNNVRGYLSFTDETTNDLAEHLDMTIEVGAAGSTCDDDSIIPADPAPAVVGTGKMNAVANAHPDYDSGLDTQWRPGAGDRERPFRLTATLPDTAGNEAQDKEAHPVFTWEVRTGSGAVR